MDGVKAEAEQHSSPMVRLLRQLRWKPLAIAAAVCTAVYVTIIFLNSSTGAILYWLAFLVIFLGCFAVAFTFTLTGKGRDAVTLLGIAFVCTAMNITLLRNDYALRTIYRWSFHASTYKQQLFARHDSDLNGITYMEWDGWGSPEATRTHTSFMTR